MLLRAVPLLMLIGFVAVPPSPAAADQREREIVRQAMERGEVRPLSQLITEVERRHNGRMIKAELETRRGQVVWEIEILRADGWSLKAWLDATTGAEISRW